jgi:hypothetical protein
MVGGVALWLSRLSRRPARWQHDVCHGRCEQQILIDGRYEWHMTIDIGIAAAS